MTLGQRRWPGIVAAAIVVAVAAWFTFGHRSAPPPNAATQAALATARQAALATATLGEVERTVVATGRVGPDAGPQTKLAFPVAGTIAGVDVHLGQHVDAGEALAQIDATPYALAARQAGSDARAAAATAAMASVDRTSVKLRVDRTELSRQERLYRAGVVARRDVDSAQATVAADLAESQSARHSIAAAQAASSAAGAHAQAAAYDLARTVLRAPSSGVVTGIFVQPGASADATTAVVAVTPEATGLATLDTPAADAARISIGDRVRAQAGGRTFDARVAGVAPAVNPATGLAVVSIAGVPAGLPAGTPIDARIVVARVRGLVVPRSAIVVDPQNGNTLVFVQASDGRGGQRFLARVVRIDVQNDATVRIAAGLHAGERVAAQGAVDLLAPGGG